MNDCKKWTEKERIDGNWLTEANVMLFRTSETGQPRAHQKWIFICIVMLIKLEMGDTSVPKTKNRNNLWDAAVRFKWKQLKDEKDWKILPAHCKSALSYPDRTQSSQGLLQPTLHTFRRWEEQSIDDYGQFWTEWATEGMKWTPTLKVLQPTLSGQIDKSQTLRPLTPWTLRRSSTTPPWGAMELPSRGAMLHVPRQCQVVSTWRETGKKRSATVMWTILTLVTHSISRRVGYPHCCIPKVRGLHVCWSWELSARAAFQVLMAWSKNLDWFSQYRSRLQFVKMRPYRVEYQRKCGSCQHMLW